VRGSGRTSIERLRLQRNLRAERDSAALYEALAARAREPHQRELYDRLAAAEHRHAEFWAARLRDAGYAVPVWRRSFGTLLLIQLARHLGPAFLVPGITAREMRDHASYTAQDDAERAGLAREEHGHAVLMRARIGGSVGNNLRAAVLGANDGLASNFCLLMGVAGAGARPGIILLTGVAGLVGGACSMALGEWLSVTNARELAATQRPAAAALDAVSAALVSMLLFAAGAAVPLLPFALLTRAAVATSVAAALSALFLLGVATSLFNARHPLYAGLRQLLVGAAAAGVTYLTGRLFESLAAG